MGWLELLGISLRVLLRVVDIFFDKDNDRKKAKKQVLKQLEEAKKELHDAIKKKDLARITAVVDRIRRLRNK